MPSTSSPRRQGSTKPRTKGCGDERDHWSVAITGSGGTGAVTVGTILLEALAGKGLYGIMTRSYGPQIRGGESAVMLRFGVHEVQAQADRFDVLLSLDWDKVERFAEELPLGPDSVIIGEAAAGAVPEVLLKSGAQSRLIDLAARARPVEHGRPNMLALGILGGWIGLSRAQLLEGLVSVMGRKTSAVQLASEQCVDLGLSLSASLLPSLALPDYCPAAPDGRWNISGNEACAFGALLGGVRFVAAYPITPASDLLEWLSPRLEKIGGTLLQAEDELASINMIIGASFGGVPALTATSGPGLALMAESLGLAVASEIPLLVINVSRGGPSTGIPTKSEQSDLNIAVYGLHGEAPHLVVAPLSVKDCLATTRWAVSLAEQLQVPAILLSDQMMAQARVIIDAPDVEQKAPMRLRAQPEELPYQRYHLLDSGVSPMSIPGDADLQYTADGLEHNEHGTPSSLASDHLLQSHKRRHKLESHDYGGMWGEVEGQGETALLSWGSSCEAVREARQMLASGGIACRVISLRLISPLPEVALAAALKGVRRTFVIELNESGQLYHYLESHDVLPTRCDKLCRPGPLFFRAEEIARFVERQLIDEELADAS